MLGLFPSIDSGEIGGIEASGRVAWEGIVRGEWPTADGSQREGVSGKPLGVKQGEDGGGPWAHLFIYGRSEGNSVRGRTFGVSGKEKAAGRKQPNDEALRTEVIHVTSKLQAVTAALGRRWCVNRVFIWHIGLLKLLPFFWLRDARIVLFLHGIEIWKQQDWLTQFLLKRVNLFLSNSNFTWQRFLSFNPNFAGAGHRTVHLGLSLPDIASAVSPIDPPVVLMLSRMARSENYKGHREMIEAWPLVLKQVPEAELWIAGDGDLRQDLERLVNERKIEDHVRFWRGVAEEKKQELISKCRCLALPSRREGFGLVYIEALRMGRPCLVSTVDAGMEVVNPPEAGLAANPDDPHEIATAITRLIRPGWEWDRWSTRARLRYERYFTAKHFQERLIEALSQTEG